MGHAIEQLRQALASHEEPSLTTIGGLAAVVAAAEELPSAPELPFVASLLLAEWEHISERTALVDMFVASVNVARPVELDDLLDLVLNDEAVVPEVAAHLEDPLRRRAAGQDAAAGIALEAWLRLSLGQWTRSLPLLGRLDAHATAAADTAADDIDPTFLHRLIRCLGAAGEQWQDHSADMAALLRGLLHHTNVDDNVAFELAMLELRTGLESPTPEESLVALREARDHLTLTAQYEDRIDAEIFGTAIDALIAFVGGTVPVRQDVDRLKDLVAIFHLQSLSEYRHWRQPRADTAVQWLGLVDTLAHLEDLDHSWFAPADIIASVAAAYRAHRTLTLVLPPDVILRSHGSDVSIESNALSALLQPRLIEAVRQRGDGPELLDRWLVTVGRTTADPDDVAAISEIRERVRAGGAPDRPKDSSVDVSTLTELLGLAASDAAALAAALAPHPHVARILDRSAAAKVSASAVDTNIYFQEEFARICQEIHSASGLTGIRAMRVEQVTRAILLYMRWRGSVTAGSALAATFQRRFSNESDAPKETEFADDLHRHLAMNLPVLPLKEVSHIANGRVDLICHFGEISLVIECKRELNDASMQHLATLYAFQPAEYNWADSGVAFLVVLDLTTQTRRVQLGEATRVVTVPAVEPDGKPETVMVAKVQANLPSPSHQSTPAAARARAAAGVTPTEVSLS
ncbi:hypothetical protein QQG74_06405 [Micromonospora sp. FIMYZ51]|uniref:hypothetical protein n=1 Tax=Micromonospora sp. FIMYZ51 TaxID=3051832 RepID=UPI00311E719F